MQDLRSARNELGARLRRPGAGRKSAVTQQPELPAVLERLIENAVRKSASDERDATRPAGQDQRKRLRDFAEHDAVLMA